MTFPQYKELNSTRSHCLDFNDNQAKINEGYIQGELNIRRCPKGEGDEWEGPGKYAYMSFHY